MGGWVSGMVVGLEGGREGGREGGEGGPSLYIAPPVLFSPRHLFELTPSLPLDSQGRVMEKERNPTFHIPLLSSPMLSSSLPHTPN